MNYVKNTSGAPTKTDEGFPGTFSLDSGGTHGQFAIDQTVIERAESSGHWTRGRGVMIGGVKYRFGHEDDILGRVVFYEHVHDSVVTP